MTAYNGQGVALKAKLKGMVQGGVNDSQFLDRFFDTGEFLDSFHGGTGNCLFSGGLLDKLAVW